MGLSGSESDPLVLIQCHPMVMAAGLQSRVSLHFQRTSSRLFFSARPFRRLIGNKPFKEVSPRKSSRTGLVLNTRKGAEFTSSANTPRAGLPQYPGYEPDGMTTTDTAGRIMRGEEDAHVRPLVSNPTRSPPPDSTRLSARSALESTELGCLSVSALDASDSWSVFILCSATSLWTAKGASRSRVMSA